MERIIYYFFLIFSKQLANFLSIHCRKTEDDPNSIINYCGFALLSSLFPICSQTPLKNSLNFSSNRSAQLSLIKLQTLAMIIAAKTSR